MTKATDIFGKGDVSSTTKAGFVQSGLDATGGYEVPPPPPPPPEQYRSATSQVGSVQMQNESGLIKALMSRGMTEAQAKEKVSGNKRQMGYR